MGSKRFDAVVLPRDTEMIAACYFSRNLQREIENAAS